MKKLLLILLVFGTLNSSNAQTQLLSITPDTLGLGQQNITTTISGVDLIFAGASPAAIYLMGPAFLGGKQRTIINSNTMTAKFSVPYLASCVGTYHLIYMVYDSTISNYTSFSLPNAVTINSSSPSINGKVFFDTNQNGIMDVGEYPVSGAKVAISPNNTTAFTNSQGNYGFFEPAGTYTVSYPTGGFNYTLSAGSPSSYNVNLSNQSTGNDFGVLSTYNDYSTTAFHYQTTRCYDTSYRYINIQNLSGIQYTGHVDLILSSNMSYISSGFPVTVIGDTIRWPLTINPASTMTYSTLKLGNPGPGLLISSSLNVYANVLGIDSLVASHVWNFATTCSYDPNDKAANPAGVGSQHYTLFSDELEYTVRFQNTGNDTAYNVVIRDTLDSDLELSTFRILGSSNPVLTDLQPNGTARFSFINIMLPDSNVDEPGSHGFVSYAIKSKTGLAENTLIDNTAYIFFDYNPAVITNTTSNTLVSIIPTGVINFKNIEGSLSIRPNPATDFAVISFDNDLRKDLTILIRDIVGKEVYKETTRNNNLILTREILSNGVYMVTVNDATGVLARGKIEIMK